VSAIGEPHNADPISFSGFIEVAVDDIYIASRRVHGHRVNASAQRVYSARNRAGFGLSKAVREEILMTTSLRRGDPVGATVEFPAFAAIDRSIEHIADRQAGGTM